MTYSPIEQKLLTKARLIIKDKKYAHIKSVEVDYRRIQRNVGTPERPVYKETEIPVSSLAMVRNTTVPIVNNGKCLGSWENGLTKKEIEFITQLGIPRITEDTEVSYYDGMMFDLTDPAKVALFNVLMQSEVIATSLETLGNKHYYLEFSDKVKVNKDKLKQNRKALYALEGKLTIEEKRQLLYVINFTNPIDLEMKLSLMSDNDIADAFSDIVLDDDYTELLMKKAVGAGKTIEMEALLCKAIEKNVIILDAQERLHQTHGDGTMSLFAQNYDEGLQLLTVNIDVKNRILVSTSDINYHQMSVNATNPLDEMYSTEEDALDYDNIKYEEIGFLDIDELRLFVSKSNGYEQFKHRLEAVEEIKDWIFWAKIAFASQYKKPELVQFFKKHEGILVANGLKIPHINAKVFTMYELYVKVQDIVYAEINDEFNDEE